MDWNGECVRDCFLKCFLLENTLKWYFFIFKKLFLISAHQNYLKIQKNINFFKNSNLFKSVFEM